MCCGLIISFVCLYFRFSYVDVCEYVVEVGRLHVYAYGYHGYMLIVGLNEIRTFIYPSSSKGDHIPLPVFPEITLGNVC